MPFHTTDTAHIPCSFEQGLPKNAMELSHKVMNKYFNKYLPKIEEAYHCKILSPEFLSSFLHQYRQYHLESGIGNHDKFLELDPYGFMMPKNTRYGHHGNAFISFAVADITLETFDSGGSFQNISDNDLNMNRTDATNGVINDAYDQIAIESNNTTGNIHLGAYDDDGTDPNNLYQETGSIAQTNDYAFKSLTEFTLDTSKTWLTLLKQTTSNVKKKSDGAFEVESKGQAFGALPDPAGTGFSPGTTAVRLKLGHT